MSSFAMAPPKNQRLFEPGASIVLIGCRGAGKRTLGFIGALHLRRRLVTEDQHFEKVTGLSRGQYLAKYGKDLFSHQSIEVFKRMLDENRHNCIIECGMSSLSDAGQEALAAYSNTNPVVYIHREKEQILKLLDLNDAKQLLSADPSHRQCSNLEYYNLYDPPTNQLIPGSGSTTPSDGHQPRPSKLLYAREDFSSFLDLITGKGTSRAWVESPFSINAIPPEFRSYSYALRLRLSYLVDMDLEWEDMEARGDCVELIIDHWPDDLINVIARMVALIRRKLGVPIIFHVEETPRGERRRPKEERDRTDSELLELGLRLGVDYLSLDLLREQWLVEGVLKHKGRSKIIGNYSYMGFGALHWKSEEQIVNYQRAQALNCDLIRMIRFVAGDSTVEDLEAFKERLHAAVPDPKPPLIAYDFSVLGARTPMQTKILAPVKLPDVENERDHLATVCSSKNSLELNFQQFLLDPLQFYVLGANVSYSLSPAIHSAAYDFAGMPHSFQAVTCSTLENLNQICMSDSFGGASIAAPFKVAIIPHLKVKSYHATAIGAVNVLLPLRGHSGFILDHANSRNKAGPAKEFFGDNTDWSAILTCLRRAISPRNYVQPSKTTGLVIGAGGMARAAIYALIRLGCRNILIYNRTVENAQKVADHFNEWALSQGIAATTNGESQSPAQVSFTFCHVLTSLSQPWPSNFSYPTMIVSCVPAVSIDGQPQADFEMPLQWLRSPTGGVVIELAYEPAITPLIAQMLTFRDGVKPNWVIVDGLDVVSEMAIEAFELMTGRLAPKRLMKEVGRKTWEQQQRNASSMSGLGQ